jgi:hypothetical protein
MRGELKTFVFGVMRVRGGRGKNPLEELIELKQKNDLETYIKDFDILWNRSEILRKMLWYSL